MARSWGICGFLALAVACGGSSEPEMPTQYEFGGSRPVFLDVPSDYDHAEGAPLLIVLHGFGANAFTQLAYTGLDHLVDEEGVLLLAPEGTLNSSGKQFWNATEFCCDGENTGVDDVGYITGLVDEVSAVWNVSEVYLFGHSNGGYMSYRLACEHADTFAGMVSLAGLAWDNAACQPPANLRVLQVHGTDDDTVPYAGRGAEPSAAESAELWAGHNGCATTTQQASSQLDLDTTVDGVDTTVEIYDGCPASIGVELWTIAGGGHIPAVTDDFRAQVWRFLTAR